MTGGLLLSEKYKAFLKCSAPVEFLEGTTFAGKTTVGLFKFMLKVAASPKKLHIIASEDTGTAEKNIIMKDLCRLMDPKYIEVTGLFAPRGGISIIPFANYGDEDHKEMARERLMASFRNDM